MEPSGDAHAAPVIEALLRDHPHLEVVAWGGPRMELAGATMLGRTADDGVMGLAGITKVNAVRKLHDEIVAWASTRAVAVHVPVDSPSGNYPLAKRLKAKGARVVNLVAPQLWAWAPWRIKKVRAVSDVLLCLLPFEEKWFRDRGVRAKYVGHPVLSRPLDLEKMAEMRSNLAPGGPRILILPGSRSGEVRSNARLLADVFSLIQGRHRAARAVVAASSEANAKLFRDLMGGRVPPAMNVVNASGDHALEGAIEWCELALAVSGTVTLDCTRQAKPLIGVYRTSWIEKVLAKVVIRAPHLLLPNIIAGEEIVPEFVPYSGGAGPIAETALNLLGDGRQLARMRDDLRKVAATFEGRDPARAAAAVIARAASGEGLSNAQLDQIAG
jgi:lipid-A-disaccharide synthase